MHRDYSQFVRGSHIQVRLFADRLEIQSPGGLYGGVTEETLTTSQSTRNLELVRLMEDLQYVENRGSGIRAMIDAMLAAKLEPPRFQDRRTAFVVTFFNSSLLNVETMTWLKQFATYDLNDAQRFALAYLRHHHAMTNRDYQVLNRVDRTDAHRDLRGLEVVGLVQARGTGSGSTYTLAVSTALPTEIPPQPITEHDLDDAQRILSFVRTHGSINNEQCRDLLHVQESRATKLLREMVRERALRRIGAGPSTRYVLSEA